MHTPPARDANRERERNSSCESSSSITFFSLEFPLRPSRLWSCHCPEKLSPAGSLDTAFSLLCFLEHSVLISDGQGPQGQPLTAALRGRHWSSVPTPAPSASPYVPSPVQASSQMRGLLPRQGRPPGNLRAWHRVNCRPMDNRGRFHLARHFDAIQSPRHGPVPSAWAAEATLPGKTAERCFPGSCVRAPPRAPLVLMQWGWVSSDSPIPHPAPRDSP